MNNDRKDYFKQYRESHKQQRNEYSKQYRETHKEYERARKKRWRINNPDYIKDWNAANIDRRREITRQSERKRRAIKKHLNENYTKEDEQYTLNLFNNQCANCGTTDNLHIDHHNPLSEGYPLTKKNAVVLCIYCNSAKGSLSPEDFYTPEKLAFINERLDL